MADVRLLFESFHAADSAPSILSAHAALRRAFPPTASPPSASPAPAHDDYGALHAWLAPQLAYRQQAYLALLLAKWTRAAPLRRAAAAAAASTALTSPSVLISGAGPCGLRAACEAALVLPSARAVHVVELRTECTRHNVLKTWQPTFDDLVAWGLLMCTATPAAQTAQRRHGHLHVATRLLQICLLKAALLLGVNVHWGRGVCGLVDGPDGWTAWTLPADAARRYLHETARTIDAQAGAAEPDPARDDPEAQVKLGGEKDVSRLQQVSRVDYFERAASTRGAVLAPPPLSSVSEPAVFATPPPPPYDIVPMAEQAFLPVGTLLVAEGESSRLIRRCGFDRHVMKYNEAIGIIVNLDAVAAAAAGAGGANKVIEEFVIQRMAADWRASCLGPLYDAGIDLENLEYMRGSGTHFIAATTKTAVLHKLGVVRARLGTTRETLAPANVDQDALRRLARTIATAVGVPESSPLCAQHGAQLFDYSCKGVCVEPLRWLDSSFNQHRRLPVVPVGDALQNPYWPQGLGVNRGFHTAIDAVWMAYERIVTGDDAVAEQERVHAFRTMQWQTFGPALLQPGAQWQVDPLTRYAESIQRSMHLHDIDTRARESSVPERYRKAYGLKWPPA